MRDAVVQFWHSLPQQIRPLLHHELVVQVVGACDGLLYHAIGETLLPSEQEVGFE